MPVKGLFAIALAVAVMIGLALPAKKDGAKPVLVSQVATLSLN